MSTSGGTPQTCDGWLEFLALLDKCVHGLLHSLNAFALCVQLMTHLIEEGLQLWKLLSHLPKLPVVLDEQLIPLRSSSRPLRELLSQPPASPHEATPLLEVSIRRLQACVLCASLLLSDLQGVCPLEAGSSVFPLISKTFSRLAQIHGSLFILACQSTKLLTGERLLTLSSASLKLLIRDCTQYRRPSRQSD